MVTTATRNDCQIARAQSRADEDVDEKLAAHTTIALRQEAPMPAMSIEQALRRYRVFVEFYKRLLKPDVDYGAVPGATRPTLLKPGAEKLGTFFGLVPSFQVIGRAEDWTGAEHGGEPLFYYWYRCRLYRAGELVAEADGSCNSLETQYRWRWSDAAKPDDETVARMQADHTGRFASREGVWVWQQRRPNREPASLVNTVQKVAQKRALIAATLIGVNASEFFAHELDDTGAGQPVGVEKELGWRAAPDGPHQDHDDTGASEWGELPTDVEADPEQDYEGEVLRIQSIAHFNNWMAKHKPQIEAMPAGTRKEALKALCNEKHAMLKYRLRSGAPSQITDEDKAALYGETCRE